MAPPTPLAVATSSVQRLVKEEAYYHKDLASQQARIAKLEKDIGEKSADLDENAEYVLKQEKQAAEETKNVFGPLRSRIADAVAKLEEQIAIGESSGDAGAEAELVKAREVLKQGQDALKTEA
ncbi:tubulin binding cofactor A [Diaporthe sp. PMI_573]|nr:tubulin binding cofactor A [Diaporthaceae sp. PMI_573]